MYLNVVGSRFRHAAACGTLSLLVACGDSTAPGAGSEFFRLSTVNSRSLPYVCPPSTGTSVSCVIFRGELLLRRDATFTLAIEGIPFLLEGSYVRGRDSVRYTVPNGDPSQPPIVFSTAVAGDSLWFELAPPPLTLVFRSSTMPSGSIASASYVLSEANGRSGQPVILGDTTIGGTRYVYRVDFDTLRLKDGTFFEQHRAESSTAYLPSGDSLRNEDEAISFGSFTNQGGWVVLRRYSAPLPSQTRTDSLAIGDATLTRTTRLINNRSQVERYSRVR